MQPYRHRPTAHPGHLTRRALLRTATGLSAAWFASGAGALASLRLAHAQTAEEVRWAIHVTLAPGWFDPGEAPAAATPYMVLYMVHDALLKPLPGKAIAPSLAESWSESADGLTYEFVLRQGLIFHNGDPFTAEDVQYSFQRYHGAAAKTLQDRVQAVEIVEPHRVRFVLKEPWPDFLTIYGTLASGAAWIVPKKYHQQVGDDQFRQQPVGLGPYKVVSHKPGLEVIAEANPHYWRKTPRIKRLVLQSVPNASTRLAMLKSGEADIAYSLQSTVAEEVQRTASLRLASVVLGSIWWLDFPEQWDPKSPWHDQRVRLAASLAIDRQEVNQAETLGYSSLTGSVVPPELDFALEQKPHPYDPQRARQLLKEAGYPNGFDAGTLTPIPNYFSMGESVASYLQAIGIRTKIQTMERATFFAKRRERSLKGLIVDVPGVSGNASTWLETLGTSWGTRVSGGYPDLDELFRQQEKERDRDKRQALLHEIQRQMHERVVLAPMFQFSWLVGVNRRIQEAALGLIKTYPYSAPYEDLTL